jgi:hypothetical protein
MTWIISKNEYVNNQSLSHFQIEDLDFLECEAFAKPTLAFFES